MSAGTPGPAPRRKPVHMVAYMNDAGEASALCFYNPHPINLRKATWTTRWEAVTCPQCKRARPRAYASTGNGPTETTGGASERAP